MEAYSVDYDWAWGTRHPGDPVTLRAHLEFSDPETAKRAVAEFFPAKALGAGWVAKEVTPKPGPTSRVVDLTAAGEDVADAIGYAAEDLVRHFGGFPGTSVRWEQLEHER